jgi:hypothetical protein
MLQGSNLTILRFQIAEQPFDYTADERLNLPH